MTISKPERLIVSLTGKQSPGALSQVMRVLGLSNTHPLQDFNQLVTRDRYLATALFESPGARDLVKDILFQAHEHNISVRFTVAPPTNTSSSTLSTHASNDHILTLFAPRATPPHFLAAILSTLSAAGAEVSTINRLTDERDAHLCLELRVSLADENGLPALQRRLFELGRAENDCDLALQKANVLRRAKRMVVFDLSWTLVQCDAVDALLEAAGVAPDEQMAQAFRDGKLSGPDWLRRRVGLLKGVDASVVNRTAAKNLKYTHGAVELCKGLKRLGCRLAVVSSGSKFIAEWAKERLGLDYAFGNSFEVTGNNKFTGVVREPVVDTERKAELMQMLAMQERIDMEQVVAVGDGPVSAKMLAAAGMSIAFDQPDATDDVRSGRIASKSLASVLYLLGVAGDDIKHIRQGVAVAG